MDSLKDIGKLVRQQRQDKTVNELVFDPRTGTFIEKAADQVTDQDQVCTVMTKEGFANRKS